MTRYDIVTFTLSKSRVVVILTDEACAADAVAKVGQASQLRWPQHIRVICWETGDGKAHSTGTSDEMVCILQGCPLEPLRSLVTGELEA